MPRAESFIPQRPQPFEAPSTGRGDGGLPAGGTKRQRRLAAAQRNKNVVPQGPVLNRRQLFGFAVAATAVAAGGGVFLSQRPAPRESMSIPTTPEEFSGDVEEVRQAIVTMQKEVNEGRAFEQQIPRIIKMSAAYYVAEMQSLYPTRKDRYKKEDIEKSIKLFTKRGYDQDKINCGEKGGSDTMATPPHKGYVRVDKDYYIKRKDVGIMVHDYLHEFLHLTSRLKQRPEGTRIMGSSEPITHEKGLTAIIMRQNDPCGGDFIRGTIEEPVVEDAALRLADKVGVVLKPEDASYAKHVAVYRDLVINPAVDKGGFGGNFEELLGYQQETEPDLFFSSIAKKKYPGLSDSQQQIIAGTRFVLNNFPSQVYKS